jgi:hypothetical protein
VDVFPINSSEGRQFQNALNTRRKLELDTPYDFVRDAMNRGEYGRRDAVEEVGIREHGVASKGISVPNPFQEKSDTISKAFRFEEWGQKSTRWFSADRIIRFNEASSYGSRFVCVTPHPREPGLDIKMDEDEDWKVDPEQPFVCLLEFNDRLWDKSAYSSNPITSHHLNATNTGQSYRDAISSAGTTIIRRRNTVGPLLAALNADVRGGLPYRLSYRKLPEETEWESIMMDRENLIAATVGHPSTVSFTS